MVFRIAGIHVKITGNFIHWPGTEYFYKAIEAFSISDASRHDFELFINSDIQRRAPCAPVLTRFGITYFQEGAMDFFQTESSQCVIMWEKNQATISYIPHIDRFDVLFMDYIKLLYSFIVMQRGGIPLHSSAVYKDNRGAMVFFSPSGGGKTTIAKLMSSQWTVLNDEFNILMPETNGYIVYSTPLTAPESFHLCSAGRAPLMGLFRISQAEYNAVGLLPLKEQYLYLGQCIYSLIANAGLGEKILENMANLCQSLPIRRLFFSKSPAIVDAIDTLLE
jgi:hypothetical protein